MPIKAKSKTDSGGLHLSRLFRLRKTWFIAALATGLIWFWGILPEQLFTNPACTVIEDRNGVLLGARIADDGQWRFPVNAEVPAKFKSAIIAFEDRRFYSHVGVDPLAICRAMLQNASRLKVVSGASTLTMQVVRLARENRSRTLPEKAVEAIWALRLELAMDKDEILALYATHAPFGGNVVGLDAAAWRYFGRGADQLSWAETATLAVLPNNPALVHPGRGREELKGKRDRLLSILLQRKVIDELTYRLSIAEGLPDKPKPLPAHAPHLLERVRAQAEKRGVRGTRLKTTLDLETQRKANRILRKYHERLVDNGVNNGALLVVDNETAEVLAYVGNVGPADGEHGGSVDIIPASRSTGSLLKPFLYAAGLQDGLLLPEMLLPDIPTHYGGFSPKNFSNSYEGAVPADQALARSLNVPAVRLQQDYGTVRFHHLLKKLGMNTLNRPAVHYGLSLVLGGAEGSPWDLAAMYSGMARTVSQYDQSRGRYVSNGFRPLTFVKSQNDTGGLAWSSRPPVLSAVALWRTLNALTEVNRPEAQGVWRRFASSRKIAWKTGTSFGFRDAWAIGCTPTYTVAVWVGNADGEGRPGLTGVTTAAPVMFEIFKVLDERKAWFPKPTRGLVDLEICRLSGYRAGSFCETTVVDQVTAAGERAPVCAYHRLVHLDPSETFQVHGDCESPSVMVHRPWFVLPPGMEWFYKSKQSSYRPLPPYRSDCQTSLAAEKRGAMELVYPKRLTSIYVPLELDGTRGAAVFEVAHRQREKTIFWHLDDRYLGATAYFHQMPMAPEPGPHKLVLVDEDGLQIERSFQVLANENNKTPKLR